MNVYSTLRWRLVRARAITRDGARCTVSRLLGGLCSSGPLHAHHIRPVSEGGALYDLDNVGTTCARHHPTWEALRRQLVAVQNGHAPVGDTTPRCHHPHRSREARELCERRMARAARRDRVAA